MSRFFERHRAFDLAATLLVVFVAVSVADIDDYDAHAMNVHSPFNVSMTLDAAGDMFSATTDSGSDPEHVCACVLCVMILPDSFGPRVLPPSEGKLSAPAIAGIAGSPHPSEVFHPPSA